MAESTVLGAGVFARSPGCLASGDRGAGPRGLALIAVLVVVSGLAPGAIAAADPGAGSASAAATAIPACDACGAVAAGAPWGPPLPTPLRLTGTFGEHRSGHLHAGVDFSTAGQTGVAVLATAAGSIIRMRAGGLGYGRALYLDTGDGVSAVYGHLERFEPRLESLLRERQAAQGEYEIDLSLAAGVHVFARGDTLGFSGETGSGPPHLHFELRDGVSPVNPLLCGLGASDVGGVEIGPIRLHALSATSSVGAGGWLTQQMITDGSAVEAWGETGVEAYIVDRSGTTLGRLAPTRVRLFRDGVPIFERRFARIDFARDREVERIYGGLQREAGPFALRLYRWPPGAAADEFEIGGDAEGGGAITLPGAHTFCLEVEDASGYHAEASWEVHARAPLRVMDWRAAPRGETLQLGLRLAEPIDSLRLPLRLQASFAGRPQDGRDPAAGETSGAWLPLGEGWFAAGLPARAGGEVLVTDASGRALFPPLRPGAARAAAPLAEQDVGIDFAEGMVLVSVLCREPLPEVPHASILAPSGDAVALTLRGATPAGAWLFAVDVGAPLGPGARLRLALPAAGETLAVALRGLVSLAGDPPLTESRVDVTGGSLTLRANGETLFGPATLRARVVAEDDSLCARAADGRLMVVWNGAAGDSAARLPLVGPLLSIDPEWWPLRSPLAVTVAAELFGGATPAAGRWGVCGRDARGGWSWWGGALADGGFSAEIPRLGVFAILEDDAPPQLGPAEPADGARLASAPGVLRMGVREIGSGFDPRAADILLDGRMLLAAWDVDARVLWAELDAPVAAGAHRWEVRVTDRVGNTSHAAAGFTVAGDR